MNIVSIRQQLVAIHTTQGATKEQSDKYRGLVEGIYKLDPIELRVEGIKAYVESIINENVSLVISRQLLSEVGKAISELPSQTSKELSHFTLERVQPRVVSFEEQVASLRQHLASIYESEQQWQEAATVLIGIPLETGQKQYTVDYKLETYLKIARLFLENEDPIQAEAYINRASLLQTDTKNEELQIYYKFCYARVLDYR